MSTNAFRRMRLALPLLAPLGLASLGLGCHGQIGTAASGSGGSNGSGSGGSSSNNGSGGTLGGGGSNVDAAPTCRKVKDLLVGMPCSDDEVNTVTTMGPAGLQQLIIHWETDSNYQPMFQGKMVPFFRNMFQQVGFIATENFKPQLLENGGFDFGPFGTAAVGDDVYFKLVQNLQDSFALTAWQMVKEGQEPFSDVLTTTKFVMTTGLLSLYTQIEMPNDEPYNFSGGANTNTKLAWKLDYVDTISLEDALNPSSPNYMVFDDEKPANPGNSFLFGGSGGFTTCQGVGTGSATVVQFGGSSSGSGSFSNPTGGYAQLFQRLIGYTPRYPFVGSPTCWEHPSKPYMTDSDVSDWRWVTIMAKQSGDSYVQPYDLPTLRKATSIKLAMPRVGFYTTPAFLALWNTNDSNQHRVTMNQTLLAALGQSFTSDNNLTPLSEVGLASSHTTNSGECYGCHKSLDPMRMFFGNQYDFNDRNVKNPFNGSQPNPRPSAPLQAGFAFADVNWQSPSGGSTLADLGPLLLQATDQDSSNPLPLFAISVAQSLCYWANSTACDTSDSTFRDVVSNFVKGNYNFAALVKELLSSPLVTGAAATKTFGGDSNGNENVPISISRQAHLCAALSNRMGISDICALQAAVPTSAQNTTLTIAGSVAADAFSRGSPTPVTPAFPDLFYRAASEELCENIAKLVVDATGGPYTSSSSSCTDGDGLMTKFVEQVMGLNPGDSLHDSAKMILESHCAAAAKVKTTTTGGGFGGGSTGSTSAQTNSVRSTFVLACESPTSLGIGL
jgi:hypothetical protein